MSPIEQSIKQKVGKRGIPLKKWNLAINRGIVTGLNEAFIITTAKRDELIAADPKSAELIRPLLRGKDIKRYNYTFADLWIIATFPSRNYDIDDYPAIKKHLASFGMERLEQTGKKYIINGQEIKARKKTNNQWFETQDSIYYWDDFRVPGRKVYRLAPLAVLFQLYTALRISEVNVLKYSDILPDNKIHVQRMLARDTGEIRDRTKGYDGERTIYLTRNARLIIEATLAFRKENGIHCSEYIFSTTDTPIPWRTINEYLERYCSRAGIAFRSSHKLRKTSLSSMVNSGISLNAVKSFAGHVDESTTLKYYTFDREGEERRNEQIEKALNFAKKQ